MGFKPLSLPTLTHLQALVCWALHSPYWETLTVRDLLGVLKRHDVAMSESAFYQLMQRMESAGHVESEVDAEVRRRQSRATGRMQSRRYRLTRAGRDELARTMDFYRGHEGHPRRLFCADLNVTLLTEDDWNGDRAVKPAEDRGSKIEDGGSRIEDRTWPFAILDLRSSILARTKPVTSELIECKETKNRAQEHDRRPVRRAVAGD